MNALDSQSLAIQHILLADGSKVHLLNLQPLLADIWMLIFLILFIVPHGAYLNIN